MCFQSPTLRTHLVCPTPRPGPGEKPTPSPCHGAALPCEEHCGRAVFMPLTLAPGSSWGRLRAWSTAHLSGKQREGCGRHGLLLRCQRA